MFELKIFYYSEKIAPYDEGIYYSMVLDDYVEFSYHLESNLCCQVKKIKEFFEKLHKNKKVKRWLLTFSRKTYETSHKSRNF